MSFTLSSSWAITKEAGINANASWISSGAILSELGDRAEGVVCMKTRKDWVTDYANVGAEIKLALSDAVALWAGKRLIKADMSGFTSRAEAQTMCDIMLDDFNTIIKDLREEPNQKLNR